MSIPYWMLNSEPKSQAKNEAEADVEAGVDAECAPPNAHWIKY